MAGDAAPRRAPAIVTDVSVLPPGQAKITGTAASIRLTDAVGPAMPLPLRVDAGPVTIAQARIDGRPVSIVWQGGRPFMLTGSGGVDLGPTTITVDGGRASWTVQGVRPLVPGTYTLDAPVAVGTAGMAEPRDVVTFVADEHTTIDVGGTGVPVTAPPGMLHLEGPGRLVADGRFVVLSGDGTRPRRRTHLDFGPGPFVVELNGEQLTATVEGPLRER